MKKISDCEISNWIIRFEVTFYGVNRFGKSFREIKENEIIFNENFNIENSLEFTSKENVEINFLIWVDNISVDKLVTLPNDYHDIGVRYSEESIEVVNVKRYLS